MRKHPSGRILFVDNKNQDTTWIDPRTGKSSDGKTEDELVPLLQSPSSPLSLMDIITVGSPINLDSLVSESSSSSVVTVTAPTKPPQEERLLPIGPSRQSSAALISKNESTTVDSKDRVFEKFWHVLHNTPHGASETEKLIVEEKTEKVKNDSLI